MTKTSRRGFFKRAGLLFGAAVVAPRALFELLPKPNKVSEIPVNFSGNGPLTVQQFEDLFDSKMRKIMEDEYNKWLKMRKSGGKSKYGTRNKKG